MLLDYRTSAFFFLLFQLPFLDHPFIFYSFFLSSINNFRIMNEATMFSVDDRSVVLQTKNSSCRYVHEPRVLHSICHVNLKCKLPPGVMNSSVFEEKKFNPRLTKSVEEFVEIMNNLNLAYPKQIGGHSLLFLPLLCVNVTDGTDAFVLSFMAFCTFLECLPVFQLPSTVRRMIEFPIADKSVPANQVCGVFDLMDPKTREAVTKDFQPVL